MKRLEDSDVKKIEPSFFQQMINNAMNIEDEEEEEDEDEQTVEKGSGNKDQDKTGEVEMKNMEATAEGDILNKE